uniref:U-scoloptoxin(10)-Sm1a n=1 Tax=Scolopendra morsitans TaxID=943129 RepID=TXA1A_SCOMO|nr:RecName: Full=U-scoloptoxin(10)-Sm1a; Short=U-SLPTX(10)-Sm1a; Flags: Precursor [Scolopendra morsitans]
MNKQWLHFFSVLLLCYVIEETCSLKVEDLPLPKTYLKAVELAKKDAGKDTKLLEKGLLILKNNRRDCMTNCKLVDTCHRLSPECCPEMTPTCLKLDIVQAFLKAQGKL